MDCAAAFQKQAEPGFMAMASNVTSKKAGFEIEVWADQGPVEMVEACRDQKTKGVFKKTLAGKARPHRHARGKEKVEPSGHVDMVEVCRGMGGGYGISKKRLADHGNFQDKANVNPSGSDLRPFSLPSWHRHYPLQDITTLIHALQGFQVDIDAGLASSGWSEFEDSKECWHVIPASCKDTNKKSAQLLQMR